MDAIVSYPYNLTVKTGIKAMEANVVPDFLLRRSARYLMQQRLNMSYKATAEEQLEELQAFVASLKTMPIAINVKDANEEHYEVPTEFFKYVLGMQMKYSCCYFSKANSTLNEAEDYMFNMYCDRAKMENGQDILELGCGWGSLSLFLAQRYPGSNVTGVSNSKTQKEYIEAECKRRGVKNLTIVTSDMNDFQAEGTYDRVISIEMFEHMKNYQKLLKKVSSWMRPEGLLFIHIFTHKEAAYHYEDNGEDDWFTRYFFSGGTMPADSLLLYFQDDVSILNHWRINGMHYQRTSEAWLKNMDKNMKHIRPIFADFYGKDNVTKWIAYWRTFFIATAELFGFNKGEEWMVSHYLFKKKA